ncbi:MAG TPA: NUDIX hydrolase [Candidatus Cloacimonas sp.]|jgi:8-oxo-dGTP diphosphatase|nr:8-oxo-dGTP diphosphatase [Candidatus Cloacimonadota bacterium]HCX73664.1 NUDIX hydrolase [Candidatus Cloacimonas sp.]
MKRAGASIIFYNSLGQVLLFLRDDDAAIPYPNMWDLPGGHVEPGESPRQCIVREMKEEMELELSDFELLHKKEFTDRIEYTYYKQLDLQIEQINLHEGQKLAWFTLEEVANTILAYGSNEILADFASYIKKESASQKS